MWGGETINNEMTFWEMNRKPLIIIGCLVVGVVLALLVFSECQSNYYIESYREFCATYPPVPEYNPAQFPELYDDLVEEWHRICDPQGQ